MGDIRFLYVLAKLKTPILSGGHDHLSITQPLQVKRERQPAPECAAARGAVSGPRIAAVCFVASLRFDGSRTPPDA